MLEARPPRVAIRSVGGSAGVDSEVLVLHPEESPHRSARFTHGGRARGGGEGLSMVFRFAWSRISCFLATKERSKHSAQAISLLLLFCSRHTGAKQVIA